MNNRDESTYISSQLAIVQIAFEDDKLTFLEIFIKFRLCLGKPPIATACSPKVVRPQHQLTLGMQSAPMLEKELQSLAFRFRQWHSFLSSVLLIFGERTVEALGVG